MEDPIAQKLMNVVSMNEELLEMAVAYSDAKAFNRFYEAVRSAFAEDGLEVVKYPALGDVDETGTMYLSTVAVNDVKNGISYVVFGKVKAEVMIRTIYRYVGFEVDTTVLLDDKRAPLANAVMRYAAQNIKDGELFDAIERVAMELSRAEAQGRVSEFIKELDRRARAHDTAAAVVRSILSDYSANT
ncbi:hypothetical protein ASAC_0778 [Acidilobus saccharovorans 345-15]|uniref:Uncharacterized protein n=1 Tax=Acidilobus saccharovorans (strain DSM 16705 / JCM 18335 / VKM B-2471 / 345-15) TaxID=666510 RepID=D9Q1J6_ACIS3|nr:hypothetical protein [Acidilobus saccharovorans]ADL19184.1 hypothetical protein ASAC_0778 [Acidilobus saccharovorans 345-15]